MWELFVPLPQRSINVWTPVMWARGMSGRFPEGKWSYSFAAYPPDANWTLILDRHRLGVTSSFKKYPLREYSCVRSSGNFLAPLLSPLWRETKKARKAVRAVKMTPISPAIMMKNNSHPMSTRPIIRLPEIRVIVTKTMKNVRHKEKARASFWDRLTWMSQMSLTGIYKTWICVSYNSSGLWIWCIYSISHRKGPTPFVLLHSAWFLLCQAQSYIQLGHGISKFAALDLDMTYTFWGCQSKDNWQSKPTPHIPRQRH